MITTDTTDRWENRNAADGLVSAIAEIDRLRTELKVRAKQIGIACLRHDLTHSLECGRCYNDMKAALKRAVKDTTTSWSNTSEPEWVEQAREALKDAR